jgi:hypothetical protein
MTNPPPVIRMSLQEALNEDAGWLPIALEPQDDRSYLVSDDPTDPESAHLVTLLNNGEHFNGDVVIERFGTIPTHWMPVPVPVAKKAGA